MASGQTDDSSTSSSDEDTSFQQKLKAIVTNGQCKTDLMTSMKYVSIGNIKQFLNGTIDGMNDTQARRAYYMVVCMNDVFSDDVSQYILLFAGIHHVKAVNKQWYLWAMQNEQTYFRNLYQRITPLADSITVNQSTTANAKQNNNDETNKMYVIHPFRKKLNSIELQLGLKGPISDIFGALECIEDGDILLLVFRGTYTALITESITGKTVKIIGVQDDVKLLTKMFGDHRAFTIENGGHLEVENVNMDFGNLKNDMHGALFVGSNSSLSIKNCQLNYEENGIIVRNGAKLEVKNCSFNGGSIGIEISPVAKHILVQDSVFTNNGQITGDEAFVMAPSEEYGCIQVFDNYGDVPHDELPNEHQVVKLKCVNNTFRDNLCYPIVERSDGREDEYFIFDTDLYEMNGNKLEGANGTYTKQVGKIHDANQVYHSQFG